MKVVTLLVPCFNEEASIRPLLKAIVPICSSILEIEWRLLFVNDGSTDGTEQLLKTELRAISWCCRSRIISFSRNFGKEAALIAGLDHCDGDACIILDADLQHPPELLPLMVEQWLAGSKIVCAKPQDRRSDGLLKRLTALFFYRVFRRMSKLEVLVDASDFRLLDKAVVTAIRQCRESVRFSKGFFAWAGFQTSYVAYHQPARLQGETKWGGMEVVELCTGWHLQLLDSATAHLVLPGVGGDRRVFSPRNADRDHGAHKKRAFAGLCLAVCLRDVPGRDPIVRHWNSGRVSRPNLH